MGAVVAGVTAGLVVGYVLQRGDMCFHSTFRGLLERRFDLFRAWALAVAIGAVGLSLVYAFGPWDGLNQGLPLRPVANVAGGLMIGAGMVVAVSCTSGLFYKLGSGMLGATVGIFGWAIGELVGRGIRLPGPTLLQDGLGATVPGVLGAPRLVIAVPVLIVVLWLVLRGPSIAHKESEANHRWPWMAAGIALGLAAVASWVFAGVGGSGFGASMTGGVASLADGRPNGWLLGFLAALFVGAAIAAGTSGTMWVRGESPPRYAGLFVGGGMLGVGGIVAGGCNLGHGLSGMAQMNVSSLVVVASIVAGISLARAVQRRLFSDNQGGQARLSSASTRR